MAIRIELTFDTRDAVSLAEFWKVALGYEDEPPPAPLVAAGGSVQATFDGHHVVMAGPEGNEFCVAA
ncbi:VOC family protein [Actinoplanes sp. NPDC026619]|uniref:VOC family protein n=1 Tax=Actinoplanes sp. NPDC026619 TaxID=3155798 RepID=UPI0033C99B4E